MKKIMFNDRYGLTEAVLSGRKTMTRRIVPQSTIDKYALLEDPTIIDDARYNVGEVVAVAMSYKNIVEHLAKKLYDVGKWMDDNHITKNMAGWLNKMFVKADLMIFRIRITNINAERLQDVSDEDCFKEGIEFCYNAKHFYVNYNPTIGSRIWLAETPRKAFAALIDQISGKGTWDSNPYVFVYEFELVD